jgi:glycosyltransferase involved in cell wall biosynthesis
MDIGGTEQVIKQLISGLDATRFRNSVACIDNRIGAMGLELRAAGIDVFTLPRNPGLDWTLVKNLQQLVRDQQIDILHCHQYTPYTYGALAARSSSVKVVFTEHGRFFPDSFRWKRRFANRFLRNYTNAVTAISKATKSALVQYEWIPEENIDVIYNGIAKPAARAIDPAIAKDLGLEANHTILGTISRLDPIKNQKMMIDAFRAINQNYPKTRLLIVGDGPERAALEQHIENLKLTHSIILTGFQNDPRPYLDLVDIFLLSSHSEGTSMTLLEAMAQGKPCVVTDVGGNPEIINSGVDGLLVDAGNAAKFAEAIVKLLENPEMQLAMGQAARGTFARRFELQNMINGYENLYTAITGDEENTCG